MPRTHPPAKKHEQDALTPTEPFAPGGNAPTPANGHAPDKTFAIIPGHPLAPLAGVFNDEPLWDDFIEASQEYRKRMDARDEAE